MNAKRSLYEVIRRHCSRNKITELEFLMVQAEIDREVAYQIIAEGDSAFFSTEDEEKVREALVRDIDHDAILEYRRGKSGEEDEEPSGASVEQFEQVSRSWLRCNKTLKVSSAVKRLLRLNKTSFGDLLIEVKVLSIVQDARQMILHLRNGWLYSPPRKHDDSVGFLESRAVSVKEALTYFDEREMKTALQLVRCLEMYR